MEILLSLLVPLLGVVFALFFQHHRVQEQAAGWLQLAVRRGLRFEPAGLLGRPAVHGRIRGIEVRLDCHDRGSSRHPQIFTRVVATPIEVQPLPEGLRVTAMDTGSALLKMLGGQDIAVGDAGFDARARIRGDSAEDIRALFAEPDLPTACLDMFISSAYNRIEGGSVILEKGGELREAEAEGLLREALVLCDALIAARLRSWQAVAAERGLALEVQERRLRLEGSWEDVGIEGRADLAQGRAELRVRLPVALPDRMVVTSGRKPGALRLGDPILDGAVTVEGTSAEAAAALLCSDEVRGDLLAVLHAFPGSCVAGNCVVMQLSSASSPKLAEQWEAVRLARSLARRARPLARAARPQAQREEP